jgi:competence protein ComEA
MREWQGEAPCIHCCSRSPMWAIRLNMFGFHRLAMDRPEGENGTVLTSWNLKWLAIAVTVICLVCGAQAVPAFAQSAAPQPSKSRPIPPPEDRVDINHASADQLLKVPGMTATWAGRIIRYRPYRTKQDLLDRGVLPGDVYDRIKDYVIAHRDKQ